MTQILSGICPEGIMVATDSMATSFDEDGKANHFTVDKLFSIGSHAFIVSGGMGISVELSMQFKRYAEERKLIGIEEITSGVGPYLSEQYREVLRHGTGHKVTNEELDRIYFVVGGYSFRSQEEPYQLALWGSDAGQLPLQRIQIGPCLAVPRTMSGEMKLFQMCKSNCQLSELIEFAEAFLQKQSEVNPQIGPPFRVGKITASGFTRLDRDQKPPETETR